MSPETGEFHSWISLSLNPICRVRFASRPSLESRAHFKVYHLLPGLEELGNEDTNQMIPKLDQSPRYQGVVVDSTKSLRSTCRSSFLVKFESIVGSAVQGCPQGRIQARPDF